MATENTREKERQAAVRKAKKSKKMRRRKRMIAISIIAVLMVAITIVTLSLTVFFNIKTISVAGSNKYSAEQIMDSAEVKEGDNLFRLSYSEISKRLQYELPYIASVKIERKLPDGLKISVKETKDEICFYSDNALYTADLSGKVLSKIDTCDEKLIKIKVSSETKLKVGQTVSFANDKESELFKLYSNAVRNNNWNVARIDISDPYASYLCIENRLVVKMGSALYFDEKTDYLNAGLKSILKDDIGVFDLSAWSPENNDPVLKREDISSYEF